MNIDKMSEEHTDSGGTGEQKLLPCPFCGHEALLKPPQEERGNDWWWIGCSNNHCPIDCGVSPDTKEEAIRIWNKRAPSIKPSNSAASPSVGDKDVVETDAADRAAFEAWYEENVSKDFIPEQREFHSFHAVFGSDVLAAWQAARACYAPKVTRTQAIKIIEAAFSERFKDAPESHRIEAMAAIQALAAAGVQFAGDE